MGYKYIWHCDLNTDKVIFIFYFKKYRSVRIAQIDSFKKLVLFIYSTVLMNVEFHTDTEKNTLHF